MRRPNIGLRQAPDPRALADDLGRWYRTPIGETLHAVQKEFCDQVLPGLPGYRAMLLSASGDGDLLESAVQLHRFTLAPLREGSVAAVSDYEALPLPSDLLDVAVLHHVLDYCPLPHETLNEVARAVTAGGHIVVFGFNPFGWLGLLRWPAGLRSDSSFWRCRCLSAGRVIDWLRLLGFQCRTVRKGGFMLPVQSRRLISASRRFEDFCQRSEMPFGAFYMVVAQKLVKKPIGKPRPLWLPKPVAPLTVRHNGRPELGFGKRRGH